MITFYETYYGQDKVYLILDGGSQIGCLKLDNISRTYGQLGIISTLSANVDDAKLSQIVREINNKYNINVTHMTDNGSTVTLY